ncbi:thioredoxin family protein [Pelagibacteraceae bacterium]|nr:thioredoxin family protein [Pelagibacteraceae bacterium]
MAIKKISDTNYKSEVLENSKTTVIKFQADFCGPCHQLTPIVEKISDEMPEVDFVSMEIDKDGVNTATEFGIRSIPQMFIMKNGKVISQKAGATDYDTVKNWLKENV